MRVGELVLIALALLLLSSCIKQEKTELLLENYSIVENFTTGKHYFMFDATSIPGDAENCSAIISYGNGTVNNESIYPIGGFSSGEKRRYKLVFTMPQGNSTLGLKASCMS